MKRNDLILVLSLLGVSVALIFLLRCFRSTGEKVVITVNDEIWAQYDLAEDRQITVATTDGYNEIVIENSAVYVEDADCRDHICMAHGKLTGIGDAIVCLPHGLVIELRGES